ncbi:MAG TPA: chloride channel protein [Oscillatoriaceae cyanobacterium]
MPSPFQPLRTAISTLARRFEDELKSPEQSGNLALLQALIIGLLAGLGTVAFRYTMGAIGTWRNRIGLVHPGMAHVAWWQWLILPAIGFATGAIAGHLVVYLAPEAKGSGIPQVKQALHEPNVHMRRRTIWVKFMAAVIGIGGGLSMGREGPTVQIGGGIGELVSRWLPHSRHERRQLIAAGAGAGIAAAFNAPIAGFVFIIEELLRDFSSHTLGTAILATVTAAVITRLLAGNIYSYALPHATFHMAEFPFYILLGVLGGLGGLLFIRGILGSMDWWERLEWLPRAWHPAFAGLFTGIVGLFMPAAIGGGHDLAEIAFSNRFPFWQLILALPAKFVLTTAAYGSGAAGGIFAPILVLGAVLGAIVGNVASYLTNIDLGIVAGFAYVGMGALFTAVARAPITSIIIVFELTGDYEHVLPLMAACVTANIVANAFKGVSIYDALAERDGANLHEDPLHAYLGDRLIDEVMTREVVTLDAHEKLDDVAHRFTHAPFGGYPVVEDGKLVGLVTRRELLQATEAHLASDTPVRAFMNDAPITIADHQPLDHAWHLLAENNIGRLIVVSDGAVVGIVTREDLLLGVAHAA